MKNQIYTAIAILGMCFGLAVGSVSAQTPGKVEVTIPFEFTAGKATLQAGVYSIRKTSANLLVLRNSEGESVILNAPLSVESKDKGERLVFNRYGDEFVLTQVWLTGETGRQLMPSGKRGKGEPVEIAIRVK